MPATLENLAVGMPVEIGKIERDLKKLWEQGGEVMTRASLINLAVYSEAPDSLGANTQLVAQITEDHACRALVIAANPAAKEDKVSAWISAHCHVNRAGSNQVCSEQISFALDGTFTKLLPSIVFSHLDSDLPFYLWWQGKFHDPIDPQLWTWVDRLIFDSQHWDDLDGQLKLIEAAEAEANQRIVLCDLNWTRLVQFRLALAQFFDATTCRAQLDAITRVEIDFAPEHRAAALLLMGWLAAQIGWTTDASSKNVEFNFTAANGDSVSVDLKEMPGEPIGRCSIFCGKTEFRVTHRPDVDLLDVSVYADGKERMHQLMPAGSNDPVNLMTEELTNGGPHRVYLRAAQMVRALR